MALVLLALPGPPARAQSASIESILYGEIVSAEQTIVVDKATGTGARAGSTVGAVAGYALADNGDRWIGSLLGGVVGGGVGHAAEKKARKKKGWTLVILLDGGEEIGIELPNRKERFETGDRVRLMRGSARTQVTKVEP